MSSMRKKDDKVIAIFCADIHLSLNPPIWRSAEPDWFEAMKRPLNELEDLSDRYKCPIICAGDIFDRWNSPPELINFAMENLPDNMYCIPGQHDLPLHNYEDIKRSAYWTLVKAGKIEDIDASHFTKRGNIILHSYPFGEGVTKSLPPTKDITQIAVVHEYKWIKGFSYPNAPKENKINKEGKLGYDVIVYGDNHKGFSGISVGSNHTTQFFNCGTLMRRRSDEINYKPQIGLLYQDGTVKPHYLDTSEDKYIESINVMNETDFDMEALFNALEKLGDTSLDFKVSIEQYMETHKVSKSVKRIILEAMESKK